MTDVYVSDSYLGYITCYHTDANCGQIQQETRTVSRDKAVNRMGLELCGHCDGIDRGKVDNSIYELAKDADVEAFAHE